MRHSCAFVVVFSVALTLLGGTSWADEELEYAAGVEMPGGDEDVGADLGGTGPQRPGLPASKRNLAALARGGRLPRFHYNKGLGPAASPLQPGSRIFMADRRLLPASSSGPAMPPMLRQQQQGWRPEGWTAAGDQALQGDAPEKMGVVGALGRLSEAAIFPYIGPHRFSFLHSMRMRRDVSSGPGRPMQQHRQEEEHGERASSPAVLSRAKRNVAALARNGWLPPAASAPSAARGTRAEFLRRFSGSQAHEASADEEFNPEDEDASDTPADDCLDEDDEEMDDILLVPSLEEVKRNLGHLARTGRLPHINYRRPWLGAEESQATSPWPQARPKRLAKRCRPRGGESKRNVAAMARKGALPRS